MTKTPKEYGSHYSKSGHYGQSYFGAEASGGWSTQEWPPRTLVAW